MTHRWMAIHRRRRRRPFVVICLALSLLVPLGASPAAADTSEGRLAFMRGFSVWVADADGADRRDLGFQGGLTWTRLSPDGATITFWGRPDGIPRLRQLDVSSGDVTNLLANPVGSPVYVYTAPSSPDGSQVAVTMQRGLTNTETYRRSLDDVNVVGAAGVVSTFNACGTMAAGKIVALDWSGDGRIWTVCQPLDSDGDQLPGARWRVFRMNADGTGQSSFHVLPADHYLNRSALRGQPGRDPDADLQLQPTAGDDDHADRHQDDRGGRHAGRRGIRRRDVVAGWYPAGRLGCRRHVDDRC